MNCPSAEGNRNALLALHFGEAGPREASPLRMHVDGCLPCRQYLAELEDLGASLRRWSDEAPPAGLGQAIVAQVLRVPQPPPHTARPRADALPLLGLLPIMAALVVLIRQVAASLPALSFWPRLDQWPTLQPIVPFAVAALALLILGGVAALAAAPALVLEARRQET